MSTYDLESLQLPKLTGTPLKLFTSALNNPAARAALLPSLLENGGIPFLRRQVLEDVPTFLPLFTPMNPSLPVKFEFDHATPEGFPYRTVSDFARAYRAGETTPLEVAERVLAAIAGCADLNLFISVYRDNVMAQARESTARYAKQSPLSWLDGVPVAVKDEVDMVPYPTTVGTNFLGKTPAREDSTVVARLRAAGALLVGKTNMHEIGINPNGFNANYGTAKNPYDPNCDPGGSSSGSAAVVAAGIVPVAIGADGGGSIRIPASLCGINGLKATFGRISEFGAAPLCWSVAHLGPLAACVEDVALVYSVIAGSDPHDINTQHQPEVSLEHWNVHDLKGLTGGIFPDWFDHADPEVVNVNRAMVDSLRSRGLAIKEIMIPDLNALRVAHAVTILSEMALCMKSFMEQRKQHGTAVQLTLKLGEALTAMDYLQAQRVRTRATATFNQVFDSVDVILTPTTARTAQPVPAGGYNGGWSDLSLDTEMMRYIIPGNLLGYPSMSFPSGYDTRGMPVGMQVIGRHWEEHLLLRVAYNAERLVKRLLPARYHG